MASRENAIVELYTTTRIEGLSQFKKLWRLLSKEPVSAQRFGGTERNLVEVRPEEASSAFKYLKQDALFVRGRANFLAFIRPRWGGFTRWTFWLSPQALTGTKEAQWIAWFGELCTLFPVLYGMIEKVSEYDSKHDTPAAQPSGVSDSEFYEYLPGVYWFNILGK